MLDAKLDRLFSCASASCITLHDSIVVFSKSVLFTGFLITVLLCSVMNLVTLLPLVNQRPVCRSVVVYTCTKFGSKYKIHNPFR